MNVLKIVLAATILFDVSVVFWVVLKNKFTDRLSKIYALLFFSIILWESAVFSGFFYYFSEKSTLLLDQFTFFIGALGLCFSFYFMWELVNRKFLHPFLVYGYTILILTLDILIWIPNALLEGRTYVDNHPYAYSLNYGPLLVPYNIILAPVFIAIIYIFIRGYYNTKGIQKTRIGLVGFGLVLAVGFPVVFSIWEPLFHYLRTGNFRVGGDKLLIIGQTTSAIMTSFFTFLSGYAITRYRFMDIKVMLQKSLVYGVAIILAICMYMGVMYVFYHLSGSVITLFFACALLVFILEPVKKKIKIWLDSIFFLEELELSKKLSEQAANIHSTQDLETYIDKTVETIQKRLRVNVLGFYVRQREHHRYFCFYPKKGVSHLYFKDEITQEFLRAEDAISITEELKMRGRRSTKELEKYLEKKKAGGVLLSKTNGTVNGIILFSKKTSGKSFSQRDVEFMKKQVEATQAHLAHLIFWHETLVGNQIILNEREYQQH